VGIDDLVDGYVREAAIDFVGLWQIVSATRQWLNTNTDEQVKRLSLEIAKRLYDHGLRPGNYHLGTRLQYWPDDGPQAMLARIDREWDKNREDPNLAEPICWFGLPKR
jgi:hypothetical protein